jgi:hypothetical protein
LPKGNRFATETGGPKENAASGAGLPNVNIGKGAKREMPFWPQPREEKVRKPPLA